MSKGTKQTFKATALAAALLGAYGPAFAEDPENSVSIGIGNWSNDRPQRGIYDGMREGKSYGLLDADILKRDDATGTSFGLKARNLGLDNREIKGEWLRQGDIGGSLEYSRIPRDNPFTFNTGVQGIGTTTLRVPIPSITPGAGTNVELGTVRERVTAQFFKSLGTGLNFNASFRNETKDGTRQWGRGGAPEFAVEPIDSTIRILETTLNYSRDNLQLSGGFYGTSYSNDIKQVITSQTNLAAASTYNLSEPLDSKSYELFLNGGYNFTPTTRGTFKMSFSRASVDEAIPSGTTPGMVWPAGQAPSALAPTRLDGHIDTTLFELGLTAKPMPKLSVVANLRYRDFADKTPVQGIVFNAANVPTVYNTPFSYTNTTGKLEATYRLPQSFSLLGGVEYKAQDRQIPNVGTLWVPFRASVDEMTYQARLTKSMSETVNGSLAYLHSKRDGSAYKVPGVAAEPEQDVINPLNIADRKRDKLRAMLDWSPTERLAFQFAIEDAKDKYSGPVGQYGLQDGTARLYSLDASFQVNSAWQLTAWISRDETKANEVTQQSAAITKYNDLGEVGVSFGLGVRGAVSEKLKVGGDVESFRSENTYRQSIAGGALPATMVPTPDITNKLLRLKLFAQYAVHKNGDLHFNLIHEKWSTDDWSWMMFPAGGPTPFAYCGSSATCLPANTSTDGTTVISNPKQHSTFLGVRYRYRFQ
jgi:MtrB/PioB family decaheme-associated outer membrane protein